MRSLRFSIAGLMGIIVLVALATAALRYASETMAAVVSLVTHGVLALAVVGAVCRTGAQRTWWLGFAALGWIYLGLPFRFFRTSQMFPSRLVLRLLAPLVGVPAQGDMPIVAGDVAAGWFFWIGHQFLALLAAVAGGLLARAIFGAAAATSLQATASASPAGEVSRRWWVLPAVIAVSGLALTTMVAVACARLDPKIAAGLTYLLTWWLIGLTALGALFARGRRREFWLGTTLLGTGFMIVVFNRPVAFDPEYPR
jgi:hypothetical protein